MNEWSIYILRCDDGSLYTGITTDVQRRLGEHISGKRKAAKYTRMFFAIDLAYHVRIGNRSLATRVERRIKKLPKGKKEQIVSDCFSREELIEFLKLDG